MATTDDYLTGPSSVRLRPVEQGDLELLLRWDEDPVIAALMGRRFENTSPAEWFSAQRRMRSYRIWIIERGEQPVGEVELAQVNHRTRSAEVRICVGERELWGQGIGTTAMTRALDEAFGPMALDEVYLRVFANNGRAIALYDRLGFQPAGVLRPSRRRNDPAPVLLMRLTRHRWQSHRKSGRAS
ncbi:RimJ/RimL family protein N-acetyltransferase [Symbiobacterium terraclitae]|uniref:RimJ/RimL family protein N-acetyltransferase n=1 Tax=Symbiobacterium terraclitae TaxID=557451 RepID=A0ABS4JUE2_9FIRM|nr:GNAT family protein [Symbiobacterium terraclitae]MBP2019148.1 RimJ/RimL family protein N-acetyltransferase [Symbiobacterium terraclitae]